MRQAMGWTLNALLMVNAVVFVGAFVGAVQHPDGFAAAGQLLSVTWLGVTVCVAGLYAGRDRDPKG